jgi:hypothetical protein
VKAVANNLPMPAGTFYQALALPATETSAKAFQTILLTECDEWRQVIIDALNNPPQGWQQEQEVIQ